MAASNEIRVIREQRKAAREARAWEREKILWDRVLTPGVVRLLLVSGIIAYSTHCARGKEGGNVGPVQSALAFALPGIGIPIIAAEAGITDKYALAAISAAGIGYTTGQMVLGWNEAGILPKADISDALGAGIPPLALYKLLT